MQYKTLIFLLACIFSTQAQTSSQPVGQSCSNIPNLGSPILMLANARQYIEDALNIKNTNTVIKYLYFALIPPTTTSVSTQTNTVIYPQPASGSNNNQNSNAMVNTATTYRLVFSISDYNGSKYIAMELAITPFGIGGVKINKFLLTSSLSLIKTLVDPNITNDASISCGDLKYVFTSFDGNQTDQLNNNPARNTIGLNILNNLSSDASSNTTNAADRAKVCVTSNFIETQNFFGTQSASTATPIDLLNCVPNKASVAAIMIGCTNNTVASLQLMFNNYSDAGTTLSAFAGNPSTPASQVTTIGLGGVDRISMTSYTTPNAIRIQTFDDKNVLIANYVCGTGNAGAQNLIVSARDFLGFTNVAGNGNITGFEVTQYRSNN